MRVSIDWLSVSYADSPYLGKVSRLGLTEFIHGLTGLNDTWHISGGRRPFNTAYKGFDSLAMIYGYTSYNGVLLELSGRAMDRIEASSPALVDTWLAMSKITRIDIALDLEERIAPAILCKDITARTLGKLQSSTGETYYVGSQKSDKFARIYLYNEPHERANSTRIEFVYRRDYAIEIARLLASGAGAKVVGNIKRELQEKGLLMTNHWHEISEDKISMNGENSRSDARTLLWLKKQVSPSIERLLANGVSQEVIIANLFGFISGTGAGAIGEEENA